MKPSHPDLSSDRPSTDPTGDLYGHAPFARTLAKAIVGYKSSDGIVLSLYGPWGSGKSTVLAYVEHELGQLPEDNRPVVVPFNPWWFSGQDSLARAFLGQLQAVLPAKYEKFKALGDKLAEFSDALGGVAGALAVGIPGVDAAVKAGAQLLGSKPKDVPALKAALSKVLLEQQKRVLVIVDDIDRLTPDEVRQLFTVIKALGDFPYVTYLLAFDREVASAAISEQTGLPGARFLEKIVQVPFELPLVDRATLQRALLAKLDDIVMPGLPEGLFDKGHWSNVFLSGLVPLFEVPRDVIRLTNSLRVTYPAVVGEVNPVDFIAIECLRVFLPEVYDTVRGASEQFTGYRPPRGDAKTAAVKFHETWLAKVPEPLRESIQELMERLFPRLTSVWSNQEYTSDVLYEWRRNLRICSPDVFATYFRLSIPAGAVSRADVDALLALTGDEVGLSTALREAAGQKGPGGMTKVRPLLDRLMDHVPTQVAAAHAKPVVSALMVVGDELLIATDKIPGLMDFGNESRVARIAYHLLKKLSQPERLQVLADAVKAGSSLRCSQFLIAAISDEATKGEQDALFSLEEATQLKATWVQYLKEQSALDGFSDHPALPVLLSGWREWGGDFDVNDWWASACNPDVGLLKLVTAYSWECASNVIGDRAVKVQLRGNTAAMEPFGDIQAMADRVQKLLDAKQVDARHEHAARQFLLECKMISEGKNPNSPSAFDRE